MSAAAAGFGNAGKKAVHVKVSADVLSCARVLDIGI